MDLSVKSELHFYWWLKELEEANIITNIKEAPKRRLSSSLLGDHVYTGDYSFNVISDSPFFHDINNMQCKLNAKKEFRLITHNTYCEVEVKPDYDQNNMTRLFQVNRKWVYEKYSIFVNLVKIPSLFKRTFTPNRYLYCDKTTKLRKINYERQRSLSDVIREAKKV